MGKTLEYGIRIDLNGHKAAADGIDQITTASVKAGTTAAQVSQQFGASQQAMAQATEKSTAAQQQFIDGMRDRVVTAGAGKTALGELQGASQAVAAASNDLSAATARVGQAQAVSNGQMNDTARFMREQSAAVQAAEAASNKFLASLQREIDLFGANRAETERYNAAKAGQSAATQRQAAAMGAAIDALHRDEAAARSAAAAQDKASAAADQFIKKLQDQVAVLGMNSQQLQTYRAAQLGVSDAAAPLIAQLAETGKGAHSAGGHMEGFSFKTAAAKRELLVLAHELSQGQFSRFGGSMMVLGEQTGAAALLFSSAGLAVLGLSAAVIGLGYAMFKGSSEQIHMNNALIMTGNYAGLTSDSLNNLAHAAVSAGGSIGEAKKVAIELAGTGKFTADQIGNITEATVAWEHATGKSVKSTIKEFESLAVQSTGHTVRASDAISRATVKLDDQYHFLTLAIYDQIRALEREGDIKGASAVATDAFARATKDRSHEIVENLGTVTRAWHGIKEAIGGAVDALGEFGKKSTPATEVKKYSGQLARFDEQVAGSNERLGRAPDAMGEGLAAARLAIVLKLTKAVEELNQADAKANAESASRVTQSEAVHAAQRVDVILLAAQKKSLDATTVALHEYREENKKIAAGDPKDHRLEPEFIKAAEAAIIKAHTTAVKGNDDRQKLLQDSLIVQQTAFARETGIYDAREKMLSLYHTRFRTSDTDYYAGRQAAREEYIAAEAISFAKETAIVDGFKARNPKEVADKKARYDELVKLHEAFVQKMTAAQGEDTVNQMADQSGVISASDDALNKFLTTLDKEAEKIEAANTRREESASTVQREEIARLDLAIAYQKQFMAEQSTNGASEEEIAQAPQILKYLEDVRAARERIATGLDVQETDKFNKRAADQAIQDWQRAGDSIADSLSNAFGTGGKAMGSMFKAYSDGVAGQLRAQKDLAAAKKLSDGDPEKVKAVDRAHLAGAQAQIKSYGDMTGAAQGFFREGSKGYAAMGAAAQVMHAAEVALTVVKGINAVLTQGAGDPYTAFARMAAMTALVVGLGVAIGGGGGPSAAEVQKKTGTGSVLGESSAKSDSIGRSIELVAANSSIELSHTAGMLVALRSIDSSIGGLASVVVRTAGIDKLGASVDTSTRVDAGATIGRFTAVGAAIPVVGAFVGAITGVATVIASKMPVIGGLVTKLFGSSSSVLDQGIAHFTATLGKVQASGLTLQSYVDVATKSKFFGLTVGNSNSTQTASLPKEVSEQFALVISNMADGVTEAAKLLGLGGSEFTAKLQSFVVDIGNISTKDLSGEEIQKQFEAAFSKVGDDMATWAVGGLTALAKVGEGAFETLTRVAANYANLDSILASSGATFGATGMASLAARERLLDLVGGIDELASKTGDFNQNFLTQAERLAPVQKYVTAEMSALGYASVTTRVQFKDAVLDLINSGKLATDTGAKTYAGLMNVASAFAQVTRATEDTTLSVQGIADQRKDLQNQFDKLTMTPLQLQAKEGATIDVSNKPLWDRVVAEQAAKDAITINNGILANQAALYTATGDKVKAAEVAQAQWLAAVAAMDPALRASATTAHDAQVKQAAANDALTISNGILSNQAALYEATGNKVKAAEVAQAQWLAAVAAMDPALRASATTAHDAQVQQKAANDALAISNGILSNQAALYAATNDKAKAAEVAQAQWLAAVAAMDPALRASATTAHDAQVKQAAANDALTISNGILSNQAALYEATGNKVKAAEVAQAQWLAAVAAMDPALRASATTAHDAQVKQAAANDALAISNGILSNQAALYEATGNKVKAAEVAQAQWLAAVAAMDPALRASATTAHNAQVQQKAANDALMVSNGILSNQAALYEATGDKVKAAQVAQSQWLATVAAMEPELRESANLAHAAQLAEKARNDAIAESNAVLNAQAQLYELNGDKAGAAVVLSLQRSAALMGMTTAVAEATLALWNAQDAAKALSDHLAENDAILAVLGATYEATGNQGALLANQEQQRLAALAKLTPEMAVLTRAMWNAQDAAKAQAEAAQVAATIATQRASIELAIAQALGNTALARERELAALDAANRSLQLHAYALADADQAVTAALAGLQRAVDAQIQAVQSGADAQVEAIRASIDAGGTALEGAQKNVDALSGIFDDIVGAVKTLRGDVASEANMQSAKSFIDMALTLAKAGVMPDAERLRDAISTVTQDRRESYQSRVDFEFAQLVQAGKLEALGQVAGVQKSLAQQQVDVLTNANKIAEDQVKAVEKAAADQIKVLKDQLTAGQDSVSAMRGVDLSVQSVAAAVNAVNGTLAALAAARAAASVVVPYTPSTPTTPSVTNPPLVSRDPPPPASAGGFANSGAPLDTSSLSTAQRAYLNYLRQSPQGADVETLAYVSQLQDIQAWKSLENVMGIKDDPTESSDAYMSRRGYADMLGWASIPGFATGGDHVGGLRVVGERGMEIEATGPSRIWNFDQTRKMLSGGGSENMEELVDVLKKQSDKLDARLEKVEEHTRRTHGLLDKLSAGGNAIRVIVIKTVAA